MMDDLNNRYDYVLGSKSPRRKDLLEELGLDFTIRSSSFEEENVSNLSAHLVPEHYAREKAFNLKPTLKEKELLITADTDVILNGTILGKPANAREAKEMLLSLSGTSHEVITGMCLMTSIKEMSFSEATQVKFKTIANEEIDYYVKHFQPFDKAGAYGIQEWIGFVGVESIKGCFFNVIGLPVPRFYNELCRFSSFK